MYWEHSVTNESANGCVVCGPGSGEKFHNNRDKNNLISVVSVHEEQQHTRDMVILSHLRCNNWFKIANFEFLCQIRNLYFSSSTHIQRKVSEREDKAQSLAGELRLP